MKSIKHLLLIFILLNITNKMSAQMLPNGSCATAIGACGNDTLNFSCCVTGCGALHLQAWYYFCLAEDMDSTQIISFKSQFGNRAFTLYGPDVVNCSQVIPANIYSSDTIAVPNPVVFTGLPAGRYYLKLGIQECYGYVRIRMDGFADSATCLACSDLPCTNCIGSFAPEPGKKYLLSAWAKEDTDSLKLTTYTNPGISLEFPNVSVTLGPFQPSGLIIDGWQRIETEFTIPAGANEMDIELSCASGDCYFDDIRVFPYDGSMKSYVYNPMTLRLAAELDERNYATFYEYDLEGKLIRIKKETERGIMTIQESKTTVVKQ